jgi:hypothetical protein
MSSQKRLKLRILEQGADAYSIVATLPNRFAARALEKIVSKILQIQQGFEPDEILKTLTQKLRIKVIEEKYELIFKSLRNRFKLICSELMFIRNYPLELPLRSMPKLRNTTGIHKGKFIGIKGKFLLYDSKGLNAVRLDEMLGNFFMFRN